MNIGKKQLWLAVSVFFFVCAVPICYLWGKLHFLSKKEQLLAKKQSSGMLSLKSIESSLTQVMSSYGSGFSGLPKRLSGINCAEKIGIVKSVTTIDLTKIHPEYEITPYNPSIIEKDEGGYHLFFRHDKPQDVWQSHPFYSYIGYADLDNNFSPKKLVDKINTGSKFSEDPRIVKVGEEFFLSWNDKIDAKVYSRTIHSGKWNPKTLSLEYITNLDQHIKLIEKNWVPFERLVKGTPHLGFVYGIQPHKILDIPQPEKAEVIHLRSEGSTASKLEWVSKWGPLHGGSTARLINGEYISFFHSAFQEDNGIMWFVMGAYTFENTPPYKITSITPYPILFPGIYDSRPKNTSDPIKRVIYPAGIAIEKKGNNHLLHVSCGENDCAVKIVTIDYEKLRTNMTPL